MAVPAPVQPADDAAATAATDVSTRGRLLAAARELLVARGYQATTVQAVARRAGLTTGAIYANFGGKQELMAHAVLAEWLRTEVSPLADVLADASPAGHATAAAEAQVDGLDPEALARLMAYHLSVEAAPRHRLITEVTGAIIREDLAESPLLASVKMVEGLTRSSVENGKARGDISPGLSTDALVAVIVNVYLGAILSKALGLPQPDPDEVLRVLRAAGAGYAAGWPDTD
jgi:AcrR family transcriptional regulator